MFSIKERGKLNSLFSNWAINFSSTFDFCLLIFICKFSFQLLRWHDDPSLFPHVHLLDELKSYTELHFWWRYNSFPKKWGYVNKVINSIISKSALLSQESFLEFILQKFPFYFVKKKFSFILSCKCDFPSMTTIKENFCFFENKKKSLWDDGLEW